MNALVIALVVVAAAALAYFIVKRVFGWQISVLQWLSNPLGSA